MIKFFVCYRVAVRRQAADLPCRHARIVFLKSAAGFPGGGQITVERVTCGQNSQRGLIVFHATAEFHRGPIILALECDAGASPPVNIGGERVEVDGLLKFFPRDFRLTEMGERIGMLEKQVG